ncbi:MAG: hypothetical protein IPN74_01585 [Haliscomenobacter sp.]|nr:hypothetical protein [Haliscomenobacter sp.]
MEIGAGLRADISVGAVSKDRFRPWQPENSFFFQFFKKLQSNFLKELKKETKISCRWQRLVF